MINVYLTNNLTQAFEGFSGQMLFATIENLMIFIFIATAVFLIVSSPVAFFLAAVDSYYKQVKLKKEIDTCVCCDSVVTHQVYDKKICEDFIQTFSIFVSSILALFVWVALSAAYIMLYFGDSITGVLSYLKFPFDVLASYDFTNSILSITNYEANWYYMLGIFLVSIFTYQISKGLAPLLVKRSITDKLKKPSLA